MKDSPKISEASNRLLEANHEFKSGRLKEQLNEW